MKTASAILTFSSQFASPKRFGLRPVVLSSSEAVVVSEEGAEVSVCGSESSG